MITNTYFLIVGILSILFSFTHALNGKNTVLSKIDSSNIDSTLKIIIFYVWHIITVENLLFGIIFIGMAFYKNQSKVKFTAWFIAIIIIARWTVIMGSTLLLNVGAITDTLIDSVAILIFVTLIILGARKKEKIQF
ncbi:MAG: hypothetical protein AB1521_03915 [Bacteroidota bacterium]